MRKPHSSAQTHSPAACTPCYLSSSTLREGRRGTERNEAAAPHGAETECFALFVIKGGSGDAPQPSSHLQPPILLFFCSQMTCSVGWGWGWGVRVGHAHLNLKEGRDVSAVYPFDSTCD